MTGQQLLAVLAFSLGTPMLLLLIFGVSHQQSLKQAKTRGELISKGEYKGPWGFEWHQKEANRTCNGWSSIERSGGGPEPWFCADKCDVLKKCDITRKQWDQWKRVVYERWRTE